MTIDANRQLVISLWQAFHDLDWDLARSLLHEEFVCDWPQSRERICGRDNFIAVNRNYPGTWRITVDRTVAEEDTVATQVTIELTQDGRVEIDTAVSFFQLRDGKIYREVDYWPDPYEPPAWRSQWVEPMEDGEYGYMIALYSTLPESTQRRNTSTFSCGQAPSHGIEPFCTRCRMAPEWVFTAS